MVKSVCNIFFASPFSYLKNMNFYFAMSESSSTPEFENHLRTLIKFKVILLKIFSLNYHMLSPKLYGQENHNRPLLHCDICDGFEFISPFDIIDHLKEFHVCQVQVLNRMSNGKRGVRILISISESKDEITYMS